MKLKNAINFFEGMVSGTEKKSEINVYREFIQIISGLEKRNFSEPEMQSIEKELDDLELNPGTDHSVKYFKKALRYFQKYLRDTFSLTSKTYYSNLGIGLGTTFGILFGIVFLSAFERSMGISLGISAGMLIGLLIGRHMDAQAAAAGNLL